MRQDLAPTLGVAARAMRAARQEMGLEFQLTGSVALALYDLLRRGPHLDQRGRPTRLVNVNLTTPTNHDPDRAVERIAGALQQAGWLAQPAGESGPLSRHLEVSGRGLTAPVHLTTTQMPEYTRPPSQTIRGLPVSKPATLLLRTFQQIQLRCDPRDFIDLAAMERAFGPDPVDRVATTWLDKQATKNPDVDPAQLYEMLHYGLARVVTLRTTDLTAYGAGHDGPSADELKDRIAALASRLAKRSPVGGTGRVNGLQRLLAMSGQELEEMRRTAEALGIQAAYEQRWTTSPTAAAMHRRLGEKAEQNVVVATAQERALKQAAQQQARYQDGPGVGVRPPGP